MNEMVGGEDVGNRVVNIASHLFDWLCSQLFD